MLNKDNFVVIMAGGIGSRFWPVSRNKLPKQFLDFYGTGLSLLQQTVKRVQKIVPKENIFIITFKEYQEKCWEQLPELPQKNILVEPSRKNTAPTAAYASYKIRSINPLGKIMLCPSDHLILNEDEFVRIANLALDTLSSNDAIITLGIQPSRPDTGYGYIQYNEEKKLNENGIYKVKTFTEKPDIELAKTFISSGDFLWNSGIFYFKADFFIQEFSTYQPEMAEVFDERIQDFGTDQEQDAIDYIFPRLTNISIDFGVIEHSSSVFVIPSDFNWSDLGTWESIYQIGNKDYLGNYVDGKNVVIIDATNSVIKVGQDKLALIQGLEDMIVIDTPTVLLIAKRENEQKIKDYIQEVKNISGDTYL